MLITIVQLALTWLTAWLMGIAAVKALVPADLERDYGTFIAPSVGYMVFCLGAFSMSAAFGLAAATACWITMGALLVAAIATQLRPEWRVKPRELGRDLVRSLGLMLPMALLTLFPLFYFGADTYVGAVNPDFFAGVVDNYYLLEGHSVTTFAGTLADSFYPVERAAGHITASARFASGLFAIAMKLVLGVEIRTATALVIAFFMLSLPLTLYFFCRVVMQLEERAARISAWLIGLSAPTAMSYLYFYLGQNSGLPALPLVLTAAYLMLVRPGARTVCSARSSPTRSSSSTSPCCPTRSLRQAHWRSTSSPRGASRSLPPHASRRASFSSPRCRWWRTCRQRSSRCACGSG